MKELHVRDMVCFGREGTLQGCSASRLRAPGFELRAAYLRTLIR